MGGLGKSSSLDYVGKAYGSETEPAEPGSGGTADYWVGQNHPGGRGGGAIWLEVSSVASVDGVISCKGESRPSGQQGAPGSGGSIYLSAGTLMGSGFLNADGGSTLKLTTHGGASGGRIAIHTDDASGFSGIISANGGKGYQAGALGTLYFSTATLCPQVWANGGGRVRVNADTWVVPSILVSNYYLHLSTGMTMVVPGDFYMSNTSRVDIDSRVIVSNTMQIADSTFRFNG